ncbi:MAG: CoA-binding protein [Candidatus Freyarchaeota archaeon]|nr:CoA-binding protein [Candidatus Jordarchaeia archaeon]
MKGGLDEAFNPESVADVGASSKRGYFFLRSFLRFKGRVYAVNPGRSEIPELGLKVYPRVTDIPDKVDFVFIETPAHTVPGIVEDCVKKGVKLVAIFTAGFSETGRREGIELEERIKEVIKGSGTRVLGPNCLGLYNPKIGLAWRANLPLEAGDVAFISQSGGLANLVILYGYTRGLRFSKVVSFGNACDIGLEELLLYFRDDGETRVVAAYIEGVKDARGLAETFLDVSMRKPLVVWKGGRSEDGARACASHTGSLAGSHRIWGAVFRQTGVVEVRTLEELVDTALTLSFLPPIRGNRVGSISISGGASVTISDLLSEAGFRVPPLNEETIRRIDEEVRRVYPEGISVVNPVDVSAAYYNPGAVSAVIDAMTSDPNIDLIVFDLPVMYLAYSWRQSDVFRGEFMEALIKSGKNAIGKGKPFAVVLSPVGDEALWVRLRDTLVKEKIPVYPDMRRTCDALRNAKSYYDFIERRKKPEVYQVAEASIPLQAT